MLGLLHTANYHIIALLPCVRPCVRVSLLTTGRVCFGVSQSLEKYLHGPMKGKNLTDEVIDQRAAELAKAHHDSQQVSCRHRIRVRQKLFFLPFSVFGGIKERRCYVSE